MNNPNLPKRKIKHAKLLTEAGFKLDMSWYDGKTDDKTVCDVNKLIYWVNEEGIRVMFFDDDVVTIQTLIRLISKSIRYNLKKSARVTFD